MALLPADELVTFTFIEQVTTTTETQQGGEPPTSETFGSPPNQFTLDMPGAPSYPEVSQTTTDVMVDGFIYIRQIASLTKHVDDSGTIVPSKTDVYLVDGKKKIINAGLTSVIDDITA